MRRVIIIAAIAFLQAGFLSAQQHEFSLHAGGGLSTLNYKIVDGAQKGGFGGQFGLNYRYGIDNNWGVLSGVGIAMYNSTFAASRDLYTNNKAVDNFDNNPVTFDFISVLRCYEEKQNATLLQIPVMAQYLHSFGQIGAFLNAGLKIGLPLGGKFNNNAREIKNTGVYPEYVYEVQKFRGFGVFDNNPSYNGDLSFKVAIMFALEAGTKFALNDEISLYVGAFLDLGLNNIHKSIEPGFVEYNEAQPSDFKVNSVIYSQYENFTDKITPLAVGIKIALALAK